MIRIERDRFLIDGKPTYREIPQANPKVLGRLFNFRAVQATFDDENPETRRMWKYPDGSKYDPERQTNEFIAHLPEYKKHGVIGFTINFQGGGPVEGQFVTRQRWINTAFREDGSIKPNYTSRIKKVIEAAGKLGMIPIVGFFYFGQDHRLRDNKAVIQAVINAVEFLKSLKNENLLIEIANETDNMYSHRILRPWRVHELIALAREVSDGLFLVSTSWTARVLPPDEVIEEGDFVLLHGNGRDPEGIRDMVRTVRKKTHKPIVFNEDPADWWAKAENISEDIEKLITDKLETAFEEGASWGFYDQGKSNYWDGFQSPPTNWAINTRRKKAFFDKVAEIVGIKQRKS